VWRSLAAVRGGAESCVASALAGLLLLQTGCATLVSGSSQRIHVDSTPPGAEVLVDGAFVGRTPMASEVRRKDEHDVMLRMDGFLDRTVHTGRRLNLWYMGNILLGGLIGILVDDASGASFAVEPERIHVRLVEAPPEGLSEPPSPSALPLPAWSASGGRDPEDQYPEE
jgi:hypothetical protein